MGMDSDFLLPIFLSDNFPPMGDSFCPPFTAKFLTIGRLEERYMIWVATMYITIEDQWLPRFYVSKKKMGCLLYQIELKTPLPTTHQYHRWWSGCAGPRRHRGVADGGEEMPWRLVGVWRWPSMQPGAWRWPRPFRHSKKGFFLFSPRRCHSVLVSPRTPATTAVISAKITNIKKKFNRWTVRRMIWNPPTKSLFWIAGDDKQWRPPVLN